ncbi:MAG: lipid-A-disaccharide synthase [Planctomycetota bacterium]
MSKTIFFSVGEPSGDQHAARLVTQLFRLDDDLRIRGFGGDRMREAGCQIDLDLTEHAVVGILEVLPKLRQFFGFADQAEAIFAAGEVDAVVLVDFPGFNWHIAKRAKRYGIPVFYYCPPQLWAWGSWRVKKMKASVDHVLAVLPIEVEFFGSHGIATTYVGHPFFDAVADQRLDSQVLASLQAKQHKSSTVAVLPGSRTHEVHANWPIMVDAMREIHQQHPNVRFAVAGYRNRHVEFCRIHLAAQSFALPVDFYEGCTSEIIEHAAVAMMVSGSVSLELMARRTPAAVLYRVGRFLYAFGKCVVKVDSMTLPNLMPNPDQDARTSKMDPEEKVFPEIVSVGKRDTATRFLSRTINRMLEDADYKQSKVSQLECLANLYANPGASERAATELIRLMKPEESLVPDHHLSHPTKQRPSAGRLS